MERVVRCRLDHRGRAAPGPVELGALKGQVEAWALADVPAVLAEAEAAARRGWHAAGFVAYEAAPAFDRALRVRPGQADATALPLAWFGLFGEARAAPPLGVPAAPDPAPGWACETTVTEHFSALRAIRASIAEGDVYVVNHTTRFRRPWVPGDDPFEAYRRLVAGHAGGCHAYLETSAWAVACGSPELFFELSGGRLTTRPMKGTAARGRFPGEDACRAEALRTSPKERAENVMIVDLLRNDLGRVALPGSVAVPALWQVERHPTLWQLTSTVTAVQRPGTGLGEVFGALFPCGSVTGAPKVSAMGVIADLERSPRGVYCGAVGVVGPDIVGRSGSAREVAARFAVAIRTVAVDRTRGIAEYGAGGGITWESDPRAEWEEVLVKTGALTGTALSPGPGDGLLETMRFAPDGGRGRVRNLGRHLARLAASAEYLGIPLPADVEERVDEAVAGCVGETRVRLVLGRDGSVGVGTAPLDADPETVTPLKLCVDAEPVCSADAALFHKTTDRSRYLERTGRHPLADDVVLVNERGEVTETTRANLAVRVAGQWRTPPLDCGLLPGVERARLLERGELVERVVTVADLLGASEVATFSSFRGWRSALPAAGGCACAGSSPSGSRPPA